MMLMIASFASGGLALLLSLMAVISIVVAIPGFVVGAFFAVRYATFDRSRAKQEEHRRSRDRHKH